MSYLELKNITKKYDDLVAVDQLDFSVEKNEFRQDLYFRLNVVPIHAPPLREREGDVELLAESFTQRFIRSHGVPVKGLTSDALQALSTHDWPGNIRELQNVIERAVILCGEDGYIHPEQLGLTAPPQAGAGDSPIANHEYDPETTKPSSKPQGHSKEIDREYSDNYLTLAELEKRHILSALEQNDGNRTRTAEILGINIRTLRNKLKEYADAGVTID